MDKKKIKPKILIIGATGFIGYHLAKKCKKMGWLVTSFSKNKPKQIRRINKIKYVYGDIFIKKSLKKLNKEFDYVVNLGGYVDHKNKTKNYNTHFIGCQNLTNIFLKKNLKLFLQIGSGAEYGNLQSPHKENKVSIPKSIYGKPKFLATNFLLTQFKKKKFPCCIIRLYQVFGEMQDSNRIIPFITRSCLSNKLFPCSEGNQYRDFIHIDEVVNVLIKVLKSKKSLGEIYNLGSGKPIKIKTLIIKIKKLTGLGKPAFGKIKMRKEEMTKFFPDINKIKRSIKWKPKKNFETKLINLISKEKNSFKKGV